MMEILIRLDGFTDLIADARPTCYSAAEKTAEKPVLKGAYVEECFYIGHENLDALVNIKSKNELIADVVALLQSPIKNVLSQVQSAGNTITGVLKTLEERA